MQLSSLDTSRGSNRALVFATIHEQPHSLPHSCVIGHLPCDSSVSQNQFLHSCCVTSITNALHHRSRTRGPPGCIMLPVATFVIYAYTIKLRNLGGFVYHLLLFFHFRPANQPTKNRGDPPLDAHALTDQCGRNFNVFSIILKFSAPFSDILHSHYTIITPAMNFDEVNTFPPQKNESHYDILPGTRCPTILSLHVSLTPEQHLPDSSAMCCMLPLLQPLPSTEK